MIEIFYLILGMHVLIYDKRISINRNMIKNDYTNFISRLLNDETINKRIFVQNVVVKKYSSLYRNCTINNDMMLLFTSSNSLYYFAKVY